MLAGLTFNAAPLSGGFAPSGPSPASSGGTVDQIADRILDLGENFLNRRQDREDLRLAAQLNRNQALTSEQVLEFAARLNQANGTLAPAPSATAPAGSLNPATLLMIAAVGIGAIALLR